MQSSVINDVQFWIFYYMVVIVHSIIIKEFIDR